MELGVFWIPVVSLLIPIVAIIGGTVAEVNRRRTRSEERLAMLARGVPPAEIAGLLKSMEPSRAKDPMSGLGTARRTAVVLISVGLGLTLFFAVLAWVVGVRQVLAGAATGLIPLTIGLGFVVDYQLQKRELARFGLEVQGDTLRG